MNTEMREQAVGVSLSQRPGAEQGWWMLWGCGSPPQVHSSQSTGHWGWGTEVEVSHPGQCPTQGCVRAGEDIGVLILPHFPQNNDSQFLFPAPTPLDLQKTHLDLMSLGKFFWSAP